MGETSTNFENILDADKNTKGLQLSEEEFENKFKNQANRLILVKTADERFYDLDQTIKDDIKARAKTEISSRNAFPEKTDKAYNAKIAVLYLYTALEKGIPDPNMNKVTAVYDELKAAEANEEKETAAKLKASKKEAIGALTTKLEEYITSNDSYSETNWKILTNAQKSGEEAINTSTTIEEVNGAKKNSLTAMDDVLTIEEEKAAEITQSVNDKITEQEESKNNITYGEQDGKRGYYTTEQREISTNNTGKGGSLFNDGILLEKPISIQQFKEDATLTDFMEKGTKDMFSNEKTFKYITKNYTSLSQDEDINKKINNEIIDVLSIDTDLKVNKDEFNGVTLQINKDTGEYYFDVPVKNLTAKTMSKYPDTKNIHVYFNKDQEAKNVIINEGENISTDTKDIFRNKPSIEGSEISNSDYQLV